jgi:Holliday junction resolvase-like predicted endonuclease
MGSESKDDFAASFVHQPGFVKLSNAGYFFSCGECDLIARHSSSIVLT